MTEADLQRQAVTIIADAQVRGEPVPYHTRRSTGSPAGWPDLAAVVGQTLLLVECKTSTGVLGEEQARWLNALAGVRRVVVLLVTPETVDQLEASVSEAAGGAAGSRVHSAAFAVPKSRRGALSDAGALCTAAEDLHDGVVRAARVRELVNEGHGPLAAERIAAGEVRRG